MSVTNDTATLLEKIARLEKKAQNIGHQLMNQCESESALQELADKLSLLIQTDDVLLAQFSANMEAFKRFDRGIYDFFINYEPSRYVVDTVDGFANILDVKSNQYLYEYPAFLMANIQVQQYQERPQSAGAIFDSNEKNEPGFIHSETLNKILKVLNQRIEDNAEEVRPLSKFVNSTMVFGVGCGFHLELLAGQHRIKNLYVFEPELDIFYASLFIANWHQILTSVRDFDLNIHISLGEQEETFFTDVMNQSNLYGRYDMAKTFGFIHYSTPKIDALVSEFKKRFHESIQGWGFFDDAVMSIGHMLVSLKQGVPLLKKGAETNNKISEYPVFIVGNGPSLDGLVDFIKEHQQHAVIISCGTAMGALYEYGIVPDIHCEQERTFPTVEQLDYYCPEHVFKDVVLFGPSTLHPEVYAKFPVSLMAAKSEEPSASLLAESSLASLFGIHNFINPTVANTATSMALSLGFKNFYFVGVDLGYKEGGSHHSAKSMYYDGEGEDLSLYNSTGDTGYKLEGNFGGHFVTDHFYDSSRRMLEKLLTYYPSANFYNVSDGAQISGATPTPLNKVSIDLPAIKGKKAELKCLVEKSSHADNGELYQELIESLEFDGYDKFCKRLIAEIDNLKSGFESALKFMDKQYKMLLDEELCSREHFYHLLRGSILHVQAMLTRILYEAVNEDDALADFNIALSYYREFLIESMLYYRENATKPHYYDTDIYSSLKAK